MGYLKDEKGTFSPAVLESLGLDEGDIEGIRRAMEDTIVSEVGQIVSTCLAPTPSGARSPLGTTRSPDVSGSPGTGSPVAASPESGAPRSSDAAEPAEHATNATMRWRGPTTMGRLVRLMRRAGPTMARGRRRRPTETRTCVDSQSCSRKSRRSYGQTHRSTMRRERISWSMSETCARS